MKKKYGLALYYPRFVVKVQAHDTVYRAALKFPSVSGSFSVEYLLGYECVRVEAIVSQRGMNFVFTS